MTGLVVIDEIQRRPELFPSASPNTSPGWRNRARPRSTSISAPSSPVDTEADQRPKHHDE